MSAELARRAEALFIELVGLPPGARGARLEEACGGDGVLLEEVRSLLEAHEEETDFLEPRRVAGVGAGADVALGAGTLETSATPWGCVFTPDGGTLLASLFDGSVDVFDVGSRRRMRTVQAHQRLIPALAVSPDGAVFATGSEDGSLKLWETATCTRLAAFELGAGEVIAAAFSADSRTLAATTAAGYVVRIDLGSSGALIRGNEAFWREQVRAAEPAGAGAGR